VSKAVPEVLVAVEHQSGCWHVAVSRQEPAEIPIIDKSDASLVALAERLCGSSGGPLVRAVVFVANAPNRDPQILTRYPRLVTRITRAQALSGGIRESCLVIDASLDIECSLVFNVAGTILQQRVLGGIADAWRTAQALSVTRCLQLGHSESDLEVQGTQGWAEPEYCDTNDVLEGARAIGHELSLLTGVTRRANVLCMRAARRIEYPIVRPRLPLFDPREGSLAEQMAGKPALLISDRHVMDIYGLEWRAYARHHLTVVDELIFDLRETSKTWTRVQEICAKAAEIELPRNGVIVGFGGGLVLDVAGLAASVYRRGIGYLRIPTTLVGLVDVAVGIKQAVNAHGMKNLVGAFYPPMASLNDYRFLRTLPKREIACGLAEIVKMALLRDPVLLDLLEQHGSELYHSRFAEPQDIAENVSIRAELLMMEELAPNLFEEDLTRLVDFGHTFSPALEIASEFEIPNGFAVALDIALSQALATVHGLADDALLGRILALFERLGLPAWDWSMPDADRLYRSLDGIRHHRGGALNLVLVRKPGAPEFVQHVSRAALADAIKLLQRSSRPDFAAQDPSRHIRTYERPAL